MESTIAFIAYLFFLLSVFAVVVWAVVRLGDARKRLEVERDEAANMEEIDR